MDLHTDLNQNVCDRAISDGNSDGKSVRRAGVGVRCPGTLRPPVTAQGLWTQPVLSVPAGRLGAGSPLVSFPLCSPLSRSRHIPDPENSYIHAGQLLPLL